MNGSENRPVDELIARAFAGDVPSMVSERLRSQLSDFRVRLATVEPSGPATRTWARPARWRLGITVAAGIAVAAMIASAVRAQTSFAEVAAIALEQPWIRVRQVLDGKEAGEAWYARSLAISASRWQDKFEYRDYRLDVFYLYNSKRQVLYRSPEVQNTRVPFEPISAAIVALLKQECAIDKPLGSLDFLGAEREKMKLLDQEMKRVTEGGHAWLDYQLTVSHAGSTEPIRMLFRADAVTKLPALCRIEGSQDDKAATIETRFDYPAQGPADIYALGVPKTAKFVDRVPAGDLKRILETMKAGRERMDDYRAVFVDLNEPDDEGWWATRPMMLYRKGDKFRADYPAGWIGDEADQYKSPGKIDDAGRFWRERVKSFHFYPQYVLSRSTQYSSKTDLVTDADGSEHVEIVSVHRYETRMKPGEDFPPEYSMRPEFACRPPSGIGNPDQEPKLDLHPSEGPAGCILLSVQHTSDEGRINDKGVGLADKNQYWLDPERGYIVMRCDYLVTDEAGELQLHERDTTEEVARSPRGVWYATKIRRHCPQTDKANGKRIDQVYHLYVDFGVDRPDAFFDPPKVGRIH